MNFPVEVSDAAADKAYDLLVREGREDLLISKDSICNY